jgi:hypothetical protein
MGMGWEGGKGGGRVGRGLPNLESILMVSSE